ncbi:hypothetical protein [Parapedobacter soli]|uniref:hypothetical protein n=1 Tax=Parapedobacter soli TaxID=416955 RepID=UPI0021C8E748|nr:hypothetical protein [Parapedobacter soli]
MPVIKRVFFIALAALLLITAACWGYWSYRQYRSYQTTIPSAATSLVRIHVDGLIRDIVWNVLWNGAHYRSTAGGQPHALRGAQTGSAIPANLFLYQIDHPLSGEFPGIYFGSVAVKDPAAFAAWLHSQFQMEVSQGQYGTIASSARCLVVIRPTRALFALLPTKPKSDLTALTEILADMLQQDGGNVPVSKSDFHGITHDRGQVCVRTSHHRFAIGFKNGKVSFSGHYETGHPPGPLADMPHFADSNTASLWVQDDLAGFLQGRKFDIGDHTLYGDSLLRYYHGHLAMEWKGTTTQRDTIVNYDYDDNFELIETREVVDKTVPEIYASIAADSALIGYLEREGGMRGIFPLFQVNTSTAPSGYVQFHTAPQPRTLPSGVAANNDLLSLRVDFSKLRASDLPAVIAPHIQAVESLELLGRPVSGGGVAVQALLRMENPRLHSLIQLIDLH